jgi:hypothetical protein
MAYEFVDQTLALQSGPELPYFDGATGPTGESGLTAANFSEATVQAPDNDLVLGPQPAAFGEAGESDGSGDIIVSYGDPDDGDDGYHVGRSYDDGGSSGGGGGAATGDSSGSDGDSSTYPTEFNNIIDHRVDNLAALLGEQMGEMPNVDKVEYVALIWEDTYGILHTTSIDEGTYNTSPLDEVWSQVDFAHDAEVVAIMHTHPTLYNAGSAENPNWQPATQSGTLSSGDFDQLMEYGSGTAAGFDGDNYRSYLVNNGTVREYYAFDQNPDMIGLGGQATWAVASSDYGQ